MARLCWAGKLTSKGWSFDWPPSHARRFDPLVLDLNGDGVKLTSLDGSKVNFDFGGDGFAEKTGWVSAQDGLLTLGQKRCFSYALAARALARSSACAAQPSRR